MDKQIILAVLSNALDKLLQEPEHFVADLDIRSVSCDQYNAELAIKDGQVMSFYFRDAPDQAQSVINRAHAMKQYEEPDWSQWKMVHHPIYDEIAEKLGIKK